jgi:hypothetical protein
VLWIAGVTAAVLLLVQAILDLYLQSKGSGILPFEFAGTTARAEEIVNGWGGSVTTARVQLIIDYPCFTSMAIFVSLALIAVADGLSANPRLALWAVWLAWLPLLAAVADAIEDAAMLVMAGGTTGQPVPAFGLAAASVKTLSGWSAGLFLLGALFARHRMRRADVTAQ